MLTHEMNQKTFNGVPVAEHSILQYTSAPKESALVGVRNDRKNGGSVFALTGTLLNPPKC